MEHGNNRINQLVRELMNEKCPVAYLLSSLMSSMVIAIEGYNGSDDDKETLISGLFNERAEVLFREGLHQLQAIRKKIEDLQNER